MPGSGAFRVMTVGNRSGATAALRRLAAKRTSESTMMAAKLASATRPTAMLPNRKAPSIPPSQTPSHVAGKRLTATEVKEEQVRLLALLRSLNPSQVVDQICRALTFFGGIPGAPVPSSKHDFPSSAAANGSGSLFVGWLSEIFPRLGPSIPELVHTGNATTASSVDRGSSGEIRTPERGLEQAVTDNSGETTQHSTRNGLEAAAGNEGDHALVNVVETSSIMLGSTEETTARSPQMVTGTIAVSNTGNSNPIHLPMATSNGAHIAMPPKRARGRPKGSKNRPKGISGVGNGTAMSRNDLSLTDVRRGRGRPKGSKNKSKKRGATLRETASVDRRPPVPENTAHGQPASTETSQRTTTAIVRTPHEGEDARSGQQGSSEVTSQTEYRPREQNVQSLSAPSVHPEARAGEMMTRQLDVGSPLLVQQAACANAGPTPAEENAPPSKRMKASMGRGRDLRQQAHKEQEGLSSGSGASTQLQRHQQGLLGDLDVTIIGIHSASTLPSTVSSANPRSPGPQPSNVANRDSVGPRQTLSATPGINSTVIDPSDKGDSGSANTTVRNINSAYPVDYGHSFEQVSRGSLRQKEQHHLDGQHQHHNYMQSNHVIPTALASTGLGRRDQHSALTRQQLNLPDSYGSSPVPSVREGQPLPLGRKATDTPALMSHGGFGVFTSMGSTPHNLAPTNVNPRVSYTTGSDISALRDYSHPNFVGFEPTVPSARGREVAGPAYPP